MKLLSGLLAVSIAAVACARRAPDAPPNDSFGAQGLNGVAERGRGGGEGIGLCPECAGDSLAKLRIGAIVATGSLPPAVIQEVVRQDSSGFLRCYKSALHEAPDVQGRVTVVFVIAKSGAVVDASGGDSDLPDAGMVACVIHEFAGLHFPAPSEGEVHVTFPLRFFPPARNAGASTQ